jgi:hypothetical protein
LMRRVRRKAPAVMARQALSNRSIPRDRAIAGTAYQDWRVRRLE